MWDSTVREEGLSRLEYMVLVVCELTEKHIILKLFSSIHPSKFAIQSKFKSVFEKKIIQIFSIIKFPYAIDKKIHIKCNTTIC